jgi:hypothetical protein
VKKRVMPGLGPGIHVLTAAQEEDVDGRDKPGHDEKDVYFTSEHPPSAIGRNACSAGMVETSL